MLVVALITGLHALGLTYRGTVTTHDDQAERK